MVHVTVSVGVTELGSSVSVEPVPSDVPVFLVQVYVNDGVSPSASVMVPEHVKAVLVNTPVAGVIVTPLTIGSVFSTTTLA